ncbi:transposase family protein [Paenisporosarcina sp. TG-14]|uniref:transposase family protein n=1 Tax=Paenisporosarcina sp. TG-14 TaxID=1231057 RepID=UPI00178C1843
MTYNPTHCEGGSVRKIDYTVYTNGTQSSRITLPITGLNPTYLLLKKQRFICKACNYSVLDILDRRDNFTSKNHFIPSYSLVDRQNVETVAIDMNAGYVCHQSVISASEDYH